MSVRFLEAFKYHLDQPSVNCV